MHSTQWKRVFFYIGFDRLSSLSALVVGWNCFHCMKLLFHLPWVSLQYFHFIFQFSVFPLRFSQLKCPWKQVDWSGLIRTDCRCQTEMTTSLRCLRNKHNRETICMLSFVLLCITPAHFVYVSRGIESTSHTNKKQMERPPCSLYLCITVKLFASGTTTCVFLLTRISRLMFLSY